MCGVVGIVSASPVNQQIYDALLALQHRGQDSAGMVTWDDAYRLNLRKGNGLVRDVFEERHMHRLRGNMGVGHVRYPTAGTSSAAEAQPMYVNAPYGISLAHNGNLTNAKRLEMDVFRAGLRHVNTTSDSEILLNVFAHELHKIGVFEPGPEQVFEAIAGVHRRCRGAYAAVAMINGRGIAAFRDRHGIRPLAFGVRQVEDGSGGHRQEVVVASESSAINILGFDFVRDIQPGETIFIDLGGNYVTQRCAPPAVHTPCIFEHVYLAREDSIMDEVSVYKARLRMGEKLAQRILSRFGKEHDIDVVIPIPESSRTSAIPLAYALGVKFREGFVKNRYIGRTFIMPGQSQRAKSVQQKLNAIELEFQGKNVLLVEDSIVRGTTTGEIVRQARRAGARKVFMAVAAPPVRYPNVYGIDMPAAHEFLAYGRTEEEIAEAIGVDWVVYQSIEDLVAAATEGNSKLKRFECSVFDGKYVTGDIDGDYLAQLSQTRSDTVKRRRDADIVGDATVIELHNHA
ncbi:MAG: amidophosphoribosyltransferase [Gammaproteobacteria bacterium]|nr:amidophosphoribosyltransferase [Gammaproteobacteria bacterium]